MVINGEENYWRLRELAKREMTLLLGQQRENSLSERDAKLFVCSVKENLGRKCTYAFLMVSKREEP